jgi:hypothetical protein
LIFDLIFGLIFGLGNIFGATPSDCSPGTLATTTIFTDAFRSAAGYQYRVNA